MPASKKQSGGAAAVKAAAAPTSSSSVAPAPAAAAAPAASHKAAGKEHRNADDIALFAAITTYLGYAVLIVFGHLRDYVGKLTGMSRYFNAASRPPKGFAPLLQDWENFYTRRLFHRIQDCWNRPIAGAPTSRGLRVVERGSDDGNFSLHAVERDPATGKATLAKDLSASTTSTIPLEQRISTKPCVNLGSYNYLGFADDWAVTCKADVMGSVAKYPLASCTSFAEGGYTALHRQLEREVAAFLDKPAAVVFNMGYATNFLGIPALAGKGCLLLSDSLNHASIVNGARASGATIRVFKHNDPSHLESTIRAAIVEGQEKSHRPWRKIIVMVEGIYSMEGEVCRLPEVVAVTKRYKAYLYVDEAHSIGAMGATGRGVCEHTGVPTSDVDMLMGTFTKSFGAMGGYIAGSQELIDAIRSQTAGFLIDNAMSPIVCQQILTAFKVLQGHDGTNIGATKLQTLKDNANYFREKLEAMGCEVFGEKDSPVIPVMLYNPTKIACFSRECLSENLAVVVVGFPATPVLLSRTRFCVSAGHTREDIDAALVRIEHVCDRLRLRYRTSFFG